MCQNLHHICSRSATSKAYTLRIFKHTCSATYTYNTYTYIRADTCWRIKKQINNGKYLHTFSTITSGNSISMHVLCTYLFSILFSVIFYYCLCFCFVFFFLFAFAASFCSSLPPPICSCLHFTLWSLHFFRAFHSYMSA